MGSRQCGACGKECFGGGKNPHTRLHQDAPCPSYLESGREPRERTLLHYQMRWTSWDRVSDTRFFTITPQPQLPHLGPMRAQTR